MELSCRFDRTLSLFVLPLLLVVSGSFSSEKDISLYGYALFPEHVVLAAYQFLFQDPTQIVDAYAVSIFVTIAGAALSLLIMALLGYVISRRDFRFRGRSPSSPSSPSYLMVGWYLST